MLSGLRVLDFTNLLPGPLCSMLMADSGAEVIKIEPPMKGDLGRQTEPREGGVSLRHLQLNRGKKSLTLNLKDKRGRDILRTLAKEADVLLEGFRPGVMKRLGADFPSLFEANPRLVYGSLAGFGQDGPLGQTPGHDINYLGYSGVLSLMGQNPDEVAIPGVQIADVGGALLFLSGVLMALFARERTGRGCHIDTSLFDAAALFLAPVLPEAMTLAGGPKRGKLRLNGKWACYGVYPAKDGKFLSVGALEPKFWKRLCEALGRPEWVPMQYEPGQTQAELKEGLRGVFLGQDRAYWLERFKGEDVCIGPVLEPEEAILEPQARSNGLFLELDHPRAGKLIQLGLPWRFSSLPKAPPFKPAPGLGEHTMEILKGLGISQAKAAQLKKEGVV